MPALMQAVIEGYRLGTLVELEGTRNDDINGMKGQLVSYSEENNKFTVALINGTTVEVNTDEVQLPKDLRRPGEGGGEDSFDLFLGPRNTAEDMAPEIARCFNDKGFCVIKIAQEPAKVESAVEYMKRQGDEGNLSRLADEVEEGYLGSGAMGKVAWLDDDTDVHESLILANDDLASAISSHIQPYCLDIFGKSLATRSPGLVSLTLTDEEEDEFPPPDADDDILGGFLTVFRRGLIRYMHFMGPGTSKVTLENKGQDESSMLNIQQETIEITASPNTIVLYRTGCFNLSVRQREEVLSLSTTFMKEQRQLLLGDIGADFAFQATETGPQPVPGEGIICVNQSTRLMACWDNVEMYRCGLFGGCDAGVEIPFTRYRLFEDYFEADEALVKPWQTSTKHQSVVEAIEMFDNKYFEISNNDARVMDPMQRHVLEVGGQQMAMMGVTKKYANRNPQHGGISVGLDKDDWSLVPKEVPGSDGGNNVQAIISNRFSFIFNMRGPNYVADTACSSALCATHLAKACLQDRKIDKLEFHLGLGIHQCLHPGPFIGNTQSHMTSPYGRCLTFNATASGYMRGDGCSGITLKWGKIESEENDASWRASQCGQNGRSATLTAPNGLAQEEVIWKAIREANITGPESCVWNCHGTGTSLGDPIEVGAVRKVHLKVPRKTQLAVVTNKTHTGHLEGGAAMTSLIAAVLQARCSGIAPCVHLAQLNPHLESAAFDAFFASEMGTYHYSQGICHVSSFGFGGTNGHVVFWGRDKTGPQDPQAKVMKRIKSMALPQVRVMGDGPQDWEWDYPDDIEAGDSYSILLCPDDPTNTPIRFVKDEKKDDEDQEEDEDDEFWVITGNFNDWSEDRLEDGTVPGARSIVVDVPEDGTLDFRFLKNADPDLVVAPCEDKCIRKNAAIQGPAAGLTNSWHFSGRGGSAVKIDLFRYKDKTTVVWYSVAEEQ